MKLKTPTQEIEASCLKDAVCTAIQAGISDEELYGSTTEDGTPLLAALEQLAKEEADESHS
jgi:DNA-binding phage protein